MDERNLVPQLLITAKDEASASKAALESTTSGLSFEQTAAALTAFAKGGIEGGSAGTSLSALLTQLINPASTASIALNNLGISSRLTPSHMDSR